MTNTQRFEPNFVLDASASVPVHRDLELFVEGQNVLNDALYVAENFGFDARGTPRQLFVGLRARHNPVTHHHEDDFDDSTGYRSSGFPCWCGVRHGGYRVCVGSGRRRAVTVGTRGAQVSASTGGGAAPVFATAPDGGVALAQVAAPNEGSDGRLYVRLSAHHDSVSELRDSLGSLSIYGEVPPKIAYAPDGALYAAYLVTKAMPGDRWPENAMRFARSPDGGAHWTAQKTVTETASGDSVFGMYDDHALLIAADGTIYISWLSMAGDSSHTYFVRSTDRGKSWSRAALVDRGASCPCCRTAMTSGPDGTLYVAWRKIFPGGAGQLEVRDIVVAHSADQGRTWSAPTRVHVDDWHVNYCPDAGPSIKVGADGTVHIAWWTGKTGQAGVQYAQSKDHGASFSPPIPLGVGAFSRAAHAQLALGSGANAETVVAVWDDGTRQPSQIVARISRDGGLTFADAEPLSSPGNAAGYPVVSLRDAGLTVAWQERSSAEATRDSVAHARMDPKAATTYINSVGTLQVVSRSRGLR